MADNPPIVQRIATKALIVNSKGQLLILREASTYKDGTNVGPLPPAWRPAGTG